MFILNVWRMVFTLTMQRFLQFPLDNFLPVSFKIYLYIKINNDKGRKRYKKENDREIFSCSPNIIHISWASILFVYILV